MEKIRKVCGMLSIKNFLLLTVAGIVNAFGVVIFLAPVKLYDSGISGTAMLVSQLTPKWISLSLVLILKYSNLLTWVKARGRGIYNLCDLCGFDLFHCCVDHHRYSAGGCDDRIPACRK